MAKAIGPTFVYELEAEFGAELGGLHLHWFADGTIGYGDNMTPDLKARVEAVYAAHDPTKPDPAVVYGAAIAAGLAVTCTGDATLSATYAIDPAAQQLCTQEALYVQVTGKFTNGHATKPWPDQAGLPHTFTTARFIALAEAIAQYLDALGTAKAAQIAGQSAAWPSAAVTIA